MMPPHTPARWLRWSEAARTLALGVRNAVVCVLVAAAVATSCGSSSVVPSPTGTPPPTRQSGDSRVLFIGNSLTEANGLAAMVETLSREAGGTPISTASVVVGGFSLEDHWNEGTARRL